MTRIRRSPSLLPILPLIALAATAAPADGSDRPNILILLGDDIDRDTLGTWGGQARTPHLDRLAADGIRFDRVYANVAMCAPFRQELYSGRTAWRTRAMPNHSRSEQGNAFPFSKWTCFDDGLASGVVASLPGEIPAGTTCDRLGWIADLAPTLVEAAEGDIRDGDFDGASQWANFTGGDEAVHDYAYGAFTNCNIIDNRDRVFPVRSIRDPRYTLIWSPRHDEGITSNVTLTQALKWIRAGEKGKGRPEPAGSWVAKMLRTGEERQEEIVRRLHHRPEWALYDRRADPEELVNRIDRPEFEEVAERLKGELRAWLERWDDSDPVATEGRFVEQY